MNIVVCVKAVPSTTEVKMDPKTNTIVRDGRQSVVNPFDASGLEVALRLRERMGGRVTVLSMGIPDTERLLRDCLSRGADEGVLLSDRAFAGADTLATSYALSLAFSKTGRPDLVICGKMAVDGDTAQIGPELAGLLDVPCATDVREVLDVDERRIVCRRGTDAGESVVEVALPAVITVTKDIETLRMPSIAGVRAGESGPVATYTAAEVGADPARCGLNGSPTQVVRSFVPERGGEGVSVEGTAAEMAETLANVFEEVAR